MNAAKNTRKSVADRRRERQIADARRDILQAAATAFARHGYRAATMQQIAADAGYTAASLYTYFSGKQQIFDALVESTIADVLRSFQPSSAKTLEGRVTELMTRLFSLAESRRDAFSFLVRVGSGIEHGPERPRGDGTKHRVVLNEYQRWLAESSDLPDDQLEDAARVLSALSSAFFSRWIESEERSLVAQAPRVAAYFVRGVTG